MYKFSRFIMFIRNGYIKWRKPLGLEYMSIGFYATSMLITIKWIWLFKYPHVQWGHDEVLAR